MTFATCETAGAYALGFAGRVAVLVVVGGGHAAGFAVVARTDPFDLLEGLQSDRMRDVLALGRGLVALLPMTRRRGCGHGRDGGGGVEEDIGIFECSLQERSLAKIGCQCSAERARGPSGNEGPRARRTVGEPVTGMEWLSTGAGNGDWSTEDAGHADVAHDVGGLADLSVVVCARVGVREVRERACGGARMMATMLEWEDDGDGDGDDKDERMPCRDGRGLVVARPDASWG